jgi:hypothetical protein
MKQFEAYVYDKRDIHTEHPESCLGTFDVREDALKAILEYIEKMPEHKENIYKMEVVENCYE